MTAFVCSFTSACFTSRSLRLTSQVKIVLKPSAARWKRCTSVVAMQQVKTSTRHDLHPKAPASKPKFAVDGDTIETTTGQTALLATYVSLSVAETVHIILSVPPNHAILHMIAAFGAYLFTDFAVGVYHHAVDNYGSASTPLVGCKFIYQTSASNPHFCCPLQCC